MGSWNVCELFLNSHFHYASRAPKKIMAILAACSADRLSSALGPSVAHRLCPPNHITTQASTLNRLRIKNSQQPDVSKCRICIQFEHYRKSDLNVDETVRKFTLYICWCVCARTSLVTSSTDRLLIHCIHTTRAFITTLSVFVICTAHARTDVNTIIPLASIHCTAHFHF